METEIKLAKTPEEQRAEKLERMEHIYKSIDRNYKPLLYTIKAAIPNGSNHEDLLQQSILNIIERLLKCIEGKSSSMIFDEQVFNIDIEDFCDRFINKSVRRESIFIFINSTRKVNLRTKRIGLVKEHFYDGDECHSFDRFNENLELQDFYDTLPPEEVALIRLLMEENTKIEICEKLGIYTRKYYDIIDGLKQKIIDSDIIDPAKIKSYNGNRRSR